MSHSSVSTVKVAGIGNIEMAHKFPKIAKRRLKKKVEMVVHKYIGIKLDGIDLDRLLKYLKHTISVGIIPEDVLFFIATACYVINCAGILDAERSGHEFLYHSLTPLSTMKI
jgi:hypothetical protein